MIFIKFFIYCFVIDLVSSQFFQPSRIPKQTNNCPLRCPQIQSSQPSCPCIKPKNSTKCFAYDSRLQATSLDEAMFTFPDISDYSPNPKTLVPPTAIVHAPPSKVPQFAFKTTSMMAAETNAPTAASGAAGIANDFGSSCVSLECQACRMHVLEGFSNALNASSQFRVNSKREPVHGMECGYVQAKQKQKEVQQATLTKMNLQNDETVDQMVKLLMQKSRKRRDVNNNGIDDGSDSFTSVDQSELKDKLLGVSTKISCDYVRGETLSSGTPWCGLCNICWTWRKLPPEYFPAYLNEVSCDSDSACLAGFGKCRPVLRTLTVLKNSSKNSTEQWEQQSINTIAACECQVEAGTPLHSFIVR